jgi:hypothetical protein
MLEESYKLFDKSNICLINTDQDWFSKEVIAVRQANGEFGWLVPVNRCLKITDRKSFFREKLKELIDSFEFDKVHKVMTELNWTWADRGVPSVEAMKDRVRDLYNSIENRVVSNEFGYCSTGGFHLSYNPDEDEELRLVFEAVTDSVYGN